MTEAPLSSPPSSVSQNRGSGFELLCACSTAKPAPEQIAKISTHQYADFDAEEFLRLAEHHGAVALVARNLIEHASVLPTEMRQSLAARYAANLRRNLWFAAELLRITKHFAESNLRMIPYKGPVLAQSAYGDLALRGFSDLDLLISPADFPRAKQALAEIGYQPSKPLTAAVERLWLRTGYERSFDGSAGKNLLELQWRLLPYFYAVDPGPAQLRFDDLWTRSHRIELGASRISDDAPADPPALPCLAPEDSPLALSLHAAKHLWTRLIWVADIAESLRAPNLDLTLVVKRAHAAGIARILGVSFWLANHLLSAPIFPAAQELIEADPAIPHLGHACANRLARAATYDFESTEYFRQIGQLRERASDRWRYLWRLIWTPGPGDVEAVTLPGFMFPLYHGVRGARLLRKLVSSSPLK
ncbi:MAG: nucleotidyltransferase family protein [Terriglobales bacterium]